VDTSLRNWALTIGSTLVIAAIAMGHGQIVASMAGRVIDMAWWLVRPLGPL
jgi:hypothetical protein